MNYVARQSYEGETVTLHTIIINFISHSLRKKEWNKKIVFQN